MRDQNRNLNHIEDTLGPEWPKEIYPHGAGREWSTKQFDRWKADLGVEVIPFDRKALQALKDYVMGDSTEHIQHAMDWLTKVLKEEGEDEDLA